MTPLFTSFIDPVEAILIIAAVVRDSYKHSISFGIH